MTVSSTQSYVEYNADGTTTAFTIPYYFLLNSDISIQVSDASGNVTSLINGSDFTVTGAGNSGGGVVTLNTAYASGYLILIQRDPPETQEAKYYENGKFPAKSHEAALDKLTMLIQRFGWSLDTLALMKPNFFAKYFDAKNNRISNLSDPSYPQDAVTRSYLDRAISGVVGGFGWFIQSGGGAVYRTFQDKMRDAISTTDFGAVGDGVTIDDGAFSKITALSSSLPVDGSWKTYKVSTIPSGKKFFNGFWNVGGVIVPFDYTGEVRNGNAVITLGYNSAPNVNSDDLIAIGINTLLSAVGARNNIAMGRDALRSNTNGRHNIAIGISALHYLDGTSTTAIDGTRNIAIGGNAGRFMSSGNRNIILGRDAGHNLTTAALNIIVGNGAVMGDGPNTLDPGVIENQTPLTPSYAVILGTEAGKYFNAGYAVGVGHNALQNVKSDTGIVGVGPMAFANHQLDLSYWGTTQLAVSLTGTYSQSATKTITLNVNAHGMSNGFRVLLRFTTGANADTTFQDDNWFLVTVIDANTFTIQSPVSTTASGSVSISKIATTTAYSANTGGCVGVGREVGNGTSNYRSTAVGDRAGALGLGIENTAIGYQVHNAAVPGSGNTAVGAYSQTKITSTASGNVSLGVLTLNNLTVGVSNTSVGAQSMRNATTASNNVAVGGNALRGITTAQYNTAVGPDSLRYTISGGDHNYTNCTGIGYQAYVSGDNQIQLGNSSTTTYVYGTVQNRSDARDKADVEDAVLGIEFINGLRPVSGRWNLRDDYYSFNEVETGEIDENGHPATKTEIIFDEEGYKSESKKRNRLHQWFIYQEVVELITSLGLNPDDYGFLQNAKVNGGADVGSLGYDEFIPPLAKAIQQCWSRMDAIEKRLSALEGK